MRETTMTIPIKYTMTTKEASEWSGIGINRLRSIMKRKKCPFVMNVGGRKLVRVEVFKAWLDGMGNAEIC